MTAEQRLERHEEFLGRLDRILFLEADSDECANIRKLLSEGAAMFGAAAAMYSTVDQGMFQRREVWNLPSPPADEAAAEGKVCGEVIRRGAGAGVVVLDLQAEEWAAGDAQLAASGCRWYVGQGVVRSGMVYGVLALLFPGRPGMDGLDRRLLGLLARAVAAEQDRHDSRQELLVGEEKFGAFFRSSFDGVLIHDLAGRVVDANPSAERMFGYPREWLIRTNLTRLVPVESARIAREALREVKATGYSRQEITLRRMDGTLFPAEIVGSRFLYDGEPRVHGIVRDISQRRQAQEEAAEREMRFRKVFDQSLDGILLQDPEGRVIEGNGTICRMLGVTKEQLLLGMEVLELHPGEEAARRVQVAEELQTRGEARYECHFRRLDGSTFAAEVAASSFDLGGQRIVQKFVRDVTARREAEVEIRRAKEEAERANEAKSVFLATMSHEIRTPLNGILGFARLLEEGRLDEIQRQHLKMIKTSGGILLALINDILDFSRIESGKLELEDAPFDPARLLGDTLALHAPQAGEKDLSVDQEVGAGVPDLVRGDPARLRQVLMNLIGNAVKFTERGGVRVSLAVEEAGRLSFAVRDSGPGFTEEQQRQLFQPFYQTDLSATRRHGGTGLGLVICRRLVQAMGGGITAIRREDGAEFRFWIPLVETTDRTVRTKVAPVVRSRPSVPGTRILVAEDQPINARLISLLLARLGMDVQVVEDGPSVLERLRNGGPLPDAVLLDMRMPGMDGVEVARRIRAGEAGTEAARLPLVAVTANALESDKKACLDAGMDRHLPKPVSPESLERLLLDIGLLQAQEGN